MAGFKPKGCGKRGKPTHRTTHHRPTAKGNFALGASRPYTRNNLPKLFTEEVSAQDRPVSQAYLAPHQHSSEHNLQTVKEVVPNYDHSGAPRGPAFTGADGLDARSGCSHKTEDRNLRI